MKVKSINFKRSIPILLFFLIHQLGFCQWWTQPLASLPQKEGYLPGSFRFELYEKWLKGKRLALVVNHTSQRNGVALVDTLQKRGVLIKKIFAPEHGFRGTAEAGQHVNSGLDEKSGLHVISLYGKNKKPSPEMLQDVDVVLFDIQDVGARFYTYISTLKFVMEACAENRIRLIVCDRANPLGFCVSGPTLMRGFESFIGEFPIPVVHGLTMGELANMAKKNAWFKSSKYLRMNIVPCLGYTHNDTIFPELPPSPNLTTPLSILAYPSLCLFEGTNLSIGRGTDFPFQVFGKNDSLFGPFSFTPRHIIKSGPAPALNGKKCFGFRLTLDSIKECFDIRFIKYAYQKSENDSLFFNSLFNKLAGDPWLKSDIKSGQPIKFNNDKYLSKRKKYLLYPENPQTNNHDL